MGSKTGKNIWILDLSGKKTQHQLTTDGGMNPVWSPDGSQVAYYKWGKGIFSQSLDSAGGPQRLVPDEGFLMPIEWTADRFLFNHPQPKPSASYSYLAADGSRHSITTGVRVPLGASISPDGRWIAYSAIDSGVPYVYVRALTNGTRKWPVSRVSGLNPEWSADGRRLYFASVDKIMSVDVFGEHSLSFGEAEVEHAYSGRADLTFGAYDVTPDGRRFAIVDIEYGPSPGVTYVSDVHLLLPEPVATATDQKKDE